MAPTTKRPTPLIFVSHGSTMMLGEQSVVSDDWERQGRNAERRGIKGIVILVRSYSSSSFFLSISMSLSDDQKKNIDTV